MKSKILPNNYFKKNYYDSWQKKVVDVLIGLLISIIFSGVGLLLYMYLAINLSSFYLTIILRFGGLAIFTLFIIKANHLNKKYIIIGLFIPIALYLLVFLLILGSCMIFFNGF